LAPEINKSKWSPEEDAKLTEAVKELGDTDFLVVAEMVPVRTDTQCRQRWGMGVAVAAAKLAVSLQDEDIPAAKKPRLQTSTQQMKVHSYMHRRPSHVLLRPAIRFL
jgi:hypothetical protein